MIKLKKAVVTGANSGIGFESAKHLAGRNYHVIMVCRNRKKAEAAKEKISKVNKDTSTEIVLADLASQSDVRETAKKIRKNHENVDLLINNAGILPGAREVTVDGIEKSLAVNHLAPFMLTCLLKDLLKSSKSARIINVASEAHRAGKFEPDNLQLETGYNSLKAYANTKLFNIMFAYELAGRIRDTGTTAFSIHPGGIRTNLNSGGGGGSLFAFLFKIGKPFLQSPNKGAKTLVYLATEPGIEPLSGMYFKKTKNALPSQEAFDKEKCRLLWDLSETLTMSWS